MLEVETFNDIIKYFENFILTTFNKKEKSINILYLEMLFI